MGGRGRGVGGGLVYQVSGVAARYGASVDVETTDYSAAYADVYAALPRSTWAPYRDRRLPRLDA